MRRSPPGQQVDVPDAATVEPIDLPQPLTGLRIKGREAAQMFEQKGVTARERNHEIPDGDAGHQGCSERTHGRRVGRIEAEESSCHCTGQPPLLDSSPWVSIEFPELGTRPQVPCPNDIGVETVVEDEDDAGLIEPHVLIAVRLEIPCRKSLDLHAPEKSLSEALAFSLTPDRSAARTVQHVEVSVSGSWGDHDLPAIGRHIHDAHLLDIQLDGPLRRESVADTTARCTTAEDAQPPRRKVRSRKAMECWVMFGMRTLEW